MTDVINDEKAVVDLDAVQPQPGVAADELVRQLAERGLDPACWTRLIPDFSRGSETIQPDGKKELLRRVP